jgi:molybdate transport system substrate-binding protein
VSKLQRLLIPIILCMLVMASCTRSEPEFVVIKGSSQLVENPDQRATPTNLPSSHQLTVFAAASLTGAFKEIAGNYEQNHPGVVVNLNFAGSQILRTQLEQGAIADLFASADHKNIDVLLKEGLIDNNTYVDFTYNQLVVILPDKNLANIESLADIAKPGIKIVLADASVPAGNYARQILMNMSQDQQYGEAFRANVLANVVSNETDVKQVVTKVELGEADAGIVYASDAVAAPGLGTIAIPDKYNVVASYPMAIPKSGREHELASDFMAYILSAEGQDILAQWGFRPMPH